MAKLKKTLAVERPLGKAVRTGFTNIELKDIFDLGWSCVDDETDPIAKADAANALNARFATFSTPVKAVRSPAQTSTPFP